MKSHTHPELGGPVGRAAEPFNECIRKGRLAGSQENKFLTAQATLQCRHGRLLDLLGKGVAIIICNVASELSIRVLLQFFDRQRVALVKESAGNAEVMTHHGGVLGTQSGQSLFQVLVYGYQVCLPVKAFEHDAPCAAAKKGRSCLRRGHAAPDDQSGFTVPVARHFLIIRIMRVVVDQVKRMGSRPHRWSYPVPRSLCRPLDPCPVSLVGSPLLVEAKSTELTLSCQ